jgi:hypothetical protein
LDPDFLAWIPQANAFVTVREELDEVGVGGDDNAGIVLVHMADEMRDGIITLSLWVTHNFHRHRGENVDDVTVLAPEVIASRGAIRLVLTEGVMSTLRPTLLDDVDSRGGELLHRLPQHEEESVGDRVVTPTEAGTRSMNHVVKVNDENGTLSFHVVPSFHD